MSDAPERVDLIHGPTTTGERYTYIRADIHEAALRGRTFPSECENCADLRAEIARLRESLEWTDSRLRTLLARKPVRDATELLEANRRLLETPDA